MVCTFGDLTDVLWWRELNLATRAIIDWTGRILATPPAGIESPDAVSAYAEIAGKTVHTAREIVVGKLRESGDLDGDPRPVQRPVKFYERGERPLEIVTTRQWYIRNGGRNEELRDELLERGRQLQWHPPHMKVRYDNWVSGLAGDWLISRQRFFGVPVPLWYPLDADGQPDYEHPLVPDEASLPVDPSSMAPAGYTDDQRGVPGGFIGDPDVMDTWATSSLTPQIADGWRGDADLFARVFPMDVRPQSHEIIRTWLFATVVRAHLEHHMLPWQHAAISGWVLDPDRKKMSKSKGNVVTPMALLDEFGTDSIRYWSASGRLGTDTAFDQGQFKVGRRLSVKILNASKFVLGLGPVAEDAAITDPIDLSMLAGLASVVTEATAALESYDHTGALERTERFFWQFCDDYLEIVKTRAYGDNPDSARAALRHCPGRACCGCSRRCCRTSPRKSGRGGRRARCTAPPWPTVDELPEAAQGDPALLTAVAAVLQQVRKAKSQAQISMRAPVDRVEVQGAEAALVGRAETDLKAAGVIAELVLGSSEKDELTVDVTLGTVPAN